MLFIYASIISFIMSKNTKLHKNYLSVSTVLINDNIYNIDFKFVLNCYIIIRFVVNKQRFIFEFDHLQS